jgi:hypothetical protein
MPDIAMCMNPESCYKKESCYRAVAEPSEYRQSYSPFYKEGEDCRHYWRVQKEKRDGRD